MTLLASLNLASNYVLLCVVVLVPFWASIKQVPVFESFLEGATDAINIALKLMPYLVGMMVGVCMLKDSGAIDIMTQVIAPVMARVGFDPSLIPLALLRPFSGAASNVMMVDLIEAHGPDSVVALTAATIMGATETTFYLVAVLFGAVNVSRTRHAIAASLIGEVCGVVVAVYCCKLFFS
jgi:spore maturation protein B